MQAHAAGWDTLSLFAVGPDAGTRRGDFCGALMPFTCDVREVTDEWIAFGVGRKYRHRPVKMPDMVPV
ncbi:hypothetical protein [uncultured Methylobacterium sp.]|uniref:hypothetical protein n=1 Tax=uncultured Methylobacterium sp. TaxID=157278 RepID=UPI002583249E|nr:hypothetical protein [uncultured Methylobacterium sp.]